MHIILNQCAVDLGVERLARALGSCGDEQPFINLPITVVVKTITDFYGIWKNHRVAIITIFI